MPRPSFQERFLEFVEKENLARGNQRVLLAISGGIDSMAMLHVFAKSKFEVAVAHCNFSLRGEESNADMAFVKESAQGLGIPFYCKKFDNKAYAHKNKLSIQEAARELRYNWFSELLTSEGFDLVATAHNLNDSIETLLINLSRGTGIRGLAGIPKKRGTIIRPLLFATRAEIEEFAKEQFVEFRTDSSNLEEKYLRNKLRHNVIPVLENDNPAFFENFRDFFCRINESLSIIDKDIEIQKLLCVNKTGPGFSIDIEKLLESQLPKLFLHEFLKDYGFNPTVCGDLFSSLQGQSGKVFFSETHRAIKDRTKVFVEPIQNSNQPEKTLIDEKTTTVEIYGQVFSFQIKPFSKGEKFDNGPNFALLDKAKLEFPLEIRKILPGDKMEPLGMNKKKKISDILIDAKIPMPEKEKILVLVSNSRIVWLAGIRISNAFRITKETKELLVVQLTPI